MQVVEINGIKLEVDMRHAKVIENYHIGDPVKVLIKAGYGDTFISYPGIIAGFDNFEQLPTMLIAYLDVDYSGAKLEIVTLNKNSTNIEIRPKNTLDIALDKATAISSFEREIEKKALELSELKSKRDYFIANFGKHFENNNVLTD